MRSLHYIVAALLVLPVFFSCGGKNNHTPDNPDNPTPVNPNPPTPVDPTPVDPTPVDPTPPPAPPIEFRNTFRFDNNIVSTSGSGDFVAVVNPSLVTKSHDNRKVITGSYTFNNDAKTWSYTGLGKIELTDDNKIAFTPSNGSRKEYDVKISEIVSDEESVAYKLNGSWTIKETMVDFRGGNYRYEGDLNLNEVEKQARELGYEFTTHLDEGMTVTKVIVTDGLIAADFKNGQSYAAEHNLRVGSKFEFKELSKGLEGNGSVQFTDDQCIITIDTVIDDAPTRLLIKLEKK